jgi:hypothetical protein
MTSQAAAESHDGLVAEVRGLLTQYEQLNAQVKLRDQIVLMTKIQEAVRLLGIAIGVRCGFSATSARARLLSYLQASPGQVIAGLELAAISGISEYGRRIREIREAGHVVLTGPNGKHPATGIALRPDEYVFVAEQAGQGEGTFRD